MPILSVDFLINFNRFEEHLNNFTKYFFFLSSNFSVYLPVWYLCKTNIEIFSLAWQQSQQRQCLSIGIKLCILKLGSKANVSNICREEELFKLSLTDVRYFFTDCCQFCFPCFHGQYYVTIRHLPAAQNYLLGNLLKHWVSGSSGRNSCSHLSGKFELWTALSKLTKTKTKTETETETNTIDKYKRQKLKTETDSCSHLSRKFEHRLCQKSKVKWNLKEASNS